MDGGRGIEAARNRGCPAGWRPRMRLRSWRRCDRPRVRRGDGASGEPAVIVEISRGADLPRLVRYLFGPGGRTSTRTSALLPWRARSCDAGGRGA